MSADYVELESFPRDETLPTISDGLPTEVPTYTESYLQTCDEIDHIKTVMEGLNARLNSLKNTKSSLAALAIAETGSIPDWKPNPEQTVVSLPHHKHALRP
jgi:hypothetical protein